MFIEHYAGLLLKANSTFPSKNGSNYVRGEWNRGPWHRDRVSAVGGGGGGHDMCGLDAERVCTFPLHLFYGSARAELIRIAGHLPIFLFLGIELRWMFVEHYVRLLLKYSATFPAYDGGTRDIL